MMRRVKNIVGYSLIALYLCYYVSTSLFIHSHQYADKVVTHSHPYLPFEKHGMPNHTHTANQCVFISFISSCPLLATPILGVAFMFYLICILQPPKLQQYKKVYQFISNGFRAPPSYLLF